MVDLTTLYVQAPALVAAGERGLSTDEMTGLQALERQQPPGSGNLGTRSDARSHTSGVAPAR